MPLPFLTLNCLFYILTKVCAPSPLSSSPPHQPALAYQVAIRLRVQYEERLKGRQQSQRQPLFQLLGHSHEGQSAYWLRMCWGLGKGTRSSPCKLFGWWFSLCWAHGPKLVDSVDLLVMSSSLQGPLNLSPLFHKTPQSLTLSLTPDGH